MSTVQPDISVKNPYNLNDITMLKRHSKNDVLSYLNDAHRAFSDKSHYLSKTMRIEILEKAAALIASRVDDLAFQAAQEGGKPLADSIVEIKRAVDGVKTAITELWKLTGGEIPMGMTSSSMNRLAVTTRKARGVVLAISAFNHPFNLIVHQVVTAIAAGCPVLVKPASATPISCKNLVEILYEAGLPKKWCRMILCDHAVIHDLLADHRIAFLSFIGSGKVGWDLRSKLHPGATCALEHGGAAPVIVHRSADLNKALPSLLKGGYYHAGQVCVSVQRIFVDENILDSFISQFRPMVEALNVGAATDITTEVGPLISPKEVDRVHNWVTAAVEDGATLLCGGSKISETCYQPTILLNPPYTAAVSQQEVFGPVTCIYSYSNLDDAIFEANRPFFSFQAAVFSQDIDVALKCAHNLNGLAVMINDHTAFRVDWMPFGGTKDSGQGVGGIGPTMRELTYEKLIVINSPDL